MRAVVQRVDRAEVSVESQIIGSIGRGLLLYLGVGRDDAEEDLSYLSKKVAGLRIFPDEKGAMNRCVVDVAGEALVISQFTLYGDVRRGKRPSFTASMEPGAAERMYLGFISRLEALSVPCSKGRFGAMMKISSINDGPVTILVDSKRVF